MPLHPTPRFPTYSVRLPTLLHTATPHGHSLLRPQVMHIVPAAAGGGASPSAIPYHSLVPILIKVQDLQKRLLSDPPMFTKAWNWVDAHLRQLHGESSEMYRFLRQEGYSLLSTCYSLLTTYHLLLATYCLLLTTYHLLLATCYLLLITYYPPLATYYLLLTTCYLLLATDY